MLRPSAEELIEHPFITDGSDLTEFNRTLNLDSLQASFNATK